VSYEHERARPAPSGDDLFQFKKSYGGTRVSVRNESPRLLNSAHRHQAGCFQAATPRRGQNPIYTHAPVAKGLTKGFGFAAPLFVQVALRFTVVDLEAGTVIDFKTDAPPAGPVESTYPEYARQARTYGHLIASADIAADRRVRCGLLFTADGVIRWVEEYDLVCPPCSRRAVTSQGTSPYNSSEGDPGDNPVFIDGVKCWRRYRYGGHITMRDRFNCSAIEDFYAKHEWPQKG
jgi:hypothetical protein